MNKLIIDKKNIAAGFRKAFLLERIIARFIACFFLVSAVNITVFSGFDTLAFSEQVSAIRLIADLLVSFILTSAAAVVLPEIHTDSFVLLAAATAYTAVASFRKGEFAFIVSMVLILWMSAVYFCSKNEALLGKIKPGKKTALISCAALFSVCFASIAVIGVFRFLTFSTPNFDFGIFCNMFYNMKESGRVLSSCERNGILSHFAVHFSPIWYLLLPIYFVFPTPATLAAMQGLILASGIIPLLLIAKKNNLSDKALIFTGLIYAFSPVLIEGSFYDIHENCFLAPLLLWMFYFHESDNKVLFFVFALLSMAVKEDAPVYVFIFAVYIFLADRKFLRGTLLALMSAGYFVLAVYIINKYGLGIMSSRFQNLIANSNDGLFGVVKTAITNPSYVFYWLFKTEKGSEKFAYVAQLFVPLGLFPFCSKKPSRWLLLAPILINLITSYSYQYDITFQYSYGIFAFLLYAGVKNFRGVSPKSKQSFCILAVCTCFVMFCASSLSKVVYYTGLYADQKDTLAEAVEMLDTIPEESTVCATTFLVPHLTDRMGIYEVEYHNYEPDTDYVIIDTRYDNFQQFVDKYLEIGYDITGGLDGFMIIMQPAG